MLRRLLTVCSLIALVAASVSHADTMTAMQMAERALRAAEQVDDYTAEVSVSVEAPNVNIPRRTARVYFEWPDRLHVESNGLVVIPRDALLMGNLAEHLKEFAVANFAGEGSIDGRPVRCVKLLPRDAGPGSGRMLLWIDSERYLLLRSEVWRAGERQLTARFAHRRFSGYWMPRQIVTWVAKGALGDRKGPARIVLRFLDYRINEGIPSHVFEGSE